MRRDGERILSDRLASDQVSMQLLMARMRSQLDVMLWDMCRKGVIEPGKYLIKVWW